MLDLPKQSGYPRRVTRSTAGQIRRDDLTCIGIDSEVELPPSPSPWRFPHIADVNPEPRAIDEQMIGRAVVSLRNRISPSFWSRRDSVV